MKLLLILFFGLAFSSGIISQNEHSLFYPYTPQTKYEYNGPVSEVIEYSYYSKKSARKLLNGWSPIKKRLLRTLKFDDKGNLIYLLNEPRPVYKNLENDRLISKRTSYEMKFYYDQNKRLILLTADNKLSETTDSFSVKYLHENDSTVYVEFNNSNETYFSKRILNKDGDVKSYYRGDSSSWSLAYKFLYKNELLIETQNYRGGSKKESYESEYDADGNKIAGWALNTKGIDVYEALYTNIKKDNFYKVIMKSIQFDRLGTYRNRSVTYKIHDQFGNLVKEITSIRRFFKNWLVKEYNLKYENENKD